jgi:hypothetical protein
VHDGIGLSYGRRQHDRRGRVSRVDDDRGWCRRLLDPRAQGQTVRGIEVVVEDYGVDALAPQQAKDAPVVCHRRDEGEPGGSLEDALEPGPRRLVVVDDQDANGLRARCHT